MKEYGQDRIKKIIEELDLPKKTKFKGYVIQSAESEKFLFKLNDTYQGHQVQTAWSNTPENAILYSKKEKAIKEIEEAIKLVEEYSKNNLLLCLLMDSGKQLLPVPEEAVLEILAY